MRSSLRDILGDLPTSGAQARQISLLDDLDQQSGRQLGGGGSGIRLRILDNEDDYYASCRGGSRGPPPELDLKMCAEVLGTESGEFMVDFSLWPAAEDGDLSRSRISSSGSLIRTKLRRERSMMMELMKELPRMLPLLLTIGRYGRRRLNRKTTGDGPPVICSDFDSDRKDGDDKDLGKMPPLMSTLDWYGRRRLVSKRVTMSDGRLLIKMEQSLELEEQEKR